MTAVVCKVTGKRCYASVQAARKANTKNGHDLRVYWCEHCHSMHVAKRNNS